MKNATFKKVYVTDTKFDSNDLKQFIEAALDGTHASFIDKQQYEDAYDDKGNTLVSIFNKENYQLEYLGKDSLGTHHLFNITNGQHTTEIMMNNTLFSTHFSVK